MCIELQHKIRHILSFTFYTSNPKNIITIMNKATEIITWYNMQHNTLCITLKNTDSKKIHHRMNQIIGRFTTSFRINQKEQYNTNKIYYNMNTLWKHDIQHIVKYNTALYRWCIMMYICTKKYNKTRGELQCDIQGNTTQHRMKYITLYRRIQQTIKLSKAQKGGMEGTM